MTRNPRHRVLRPMSSVMQDAIGDLAPQDPLARLQMAWPQIAGRRHAEHSRPVRLRGDGAVVISCDSGTLASELQMREPQLSALIAEHLDLRCPLRFEGPAGRR